MVRSANYIIYLSDIGGSIKYGNSFGRNGRGQGKKIKYLYFIGFLYLILIIPNWTDFDRFRIQHKAHYDNDKHYM